MFPALSAVKVRANARALAETLKGYGYKLVTEGTDNHLLLWDLRPLVRPRQVETAHLLSTASHH